MKSEDQVRAALAVALTDFASATQALGRVETLYWQGRATELEIEKAVAAVESRKASCTLLKWVLETENA